MFGSNKNRREGLLTKKGKAVLGIAAVLCLVALVSLSGCAGPGTVKEAAKSESHPLGGLVVGVQKTQNVPGYTSSFADAYIQQAQEEHCAVDLVAIDGSPYSLINGPTDLGSTANNADNVRSENMKTRAAASALFASTAGKTAEVDLVKFFTYADRSLASSADGGTVVVAASGLQTTGVFNCCNEGVLTMEGDSVANYLVSQGYSLPHVKRVLWYGFGDVAGDQEEITPAVKASLKNTWEAALTAMGVEEVTFMDEWVASVNDGPVAVSASCVDIPDQKALVASAGETRLTSDLVPFKAGTAEFADPESARAAIKPFASYLASHQNATAVVSGSCASYPWDAELPKRLGQERAQAVADVLVALGVPSSRLTVVSLGDSSPDHVSDLDENGQQIPALAQQNRWVSITIK